MTEPVMKTAKGEGIEIQTAVWDGSKGPVVCIHGLTANCRSWDRIATALSPEYRVVAVDLRGRGLSDKPPTGYSTDHHVRDLANLLEDQGLEEVVLMGHSLGTYVSISFAARYPERVRRMVLVDGGGQLSGARWDEIEAAVKPSLDRLGQVFPSFEAYVAPMKQVPFLQPWDAFLETYFRYETKTVEEGVRSRTGAGNIREEMENLRRFQVSAHYPAVRCPVLILRATEGLLSPRDMILPEDVVDRMLREIPSAERLDIPGSNHYGILFKPSEVRDAAIRAFLDT